MLVPNKNGTSRDYRFGFQGQEMDDELKGEGNSLNYTFRMHDTRVGRFFATDPLGAKYPWNSPFAFSENRVLDRNELEGLETGPQYWMQYTPAAKSAGMTSDTWERQNNSKSPFAAILTATTVIDVFVTKGWLTRIAAAYYLGDLTHSMQMQTHYRDQGNDVKAKTYEKEGAEASKVVILGLLADGAVFTVGKVAQSIKFAKKIEGAKFADSNMVNDGFTNNGFFPPYKADVTLGVIKVPEEINGLVRLSGPNNIKGDWFTTFNEVKGLSAAQLKDKFSLKYEPTLITPASIQANSTVRVGEAAGVKQFNTEGGGFQIEVLDGGVNYGKSLPIK
jgi:RHS repeat-associated protein